MFYLIESDEFINRRREVHYTSYEDGSFNFPKGKHLRTLRDHFIASCCYSEFACVSKILRYCVYNIHWYVWNPKCLIIQLQRCTLENVELLTKKMGEFFQVDMILLKFSWNNVCSLSTLKKIAFWCLYIEYRGHFCSQPFNRIFQYPGVIHWFR